MQVEKKPFSVPVNISFNKYTNHPLGILCKNIYTYLNLKIDRYAYASTKFISAKREQVKCQDI